MAKCDAKEFQELLKNSESTLHDMMSVKDETEKKLSDYVEYNHRKDREIDSLERYNCGQSTSISISFVYFRKITDLEKREKERCRVNDSSKESADRAVKTVSSMTREMTDLKVEHEKTIRYMKAEFDQYSHAKELEIESLNRCESSLSLLDSYACIKLYDCDVVWYGKGGRRRGPRPSSTPRSSACRIRKRRRRSHA